MLSSPPSPDARRTLSDSPTRRFVNFGAIYFACLVWCAWLLVLGVRSTHGWTWARATGAVALAAVFPALVVLATTV